MPVHRPADVDDVRTSVGGVPPQILEVKAVPCVPLHRHRQRGGSAFNVGPAVARVQYHSLDVSVQPKRAVHVRLDVVVQQVDGSCPLLAASVRATSGMRVLVPNAVGSRWLSG